MKNTKFKIAIVYGNLNVGGGTYQLLSLANELSQNNQVTVLVNKDLTGDSYLDLKKKIKILEATTKNSTNNSLFAALFEPFIVAFKLSKLISKYDFDVLNPHEWPANWACALVKIIRRTPILWMCNDVWHLPGFARENRLLFSLFKKTIVRISDIFFSLFLDKIVVLDNKVKQVVKDYYHQDAVVVRSGIDLKNFQKQISIKEARKRLNLDENAFIFMCSSIFFGHRRFEDAIDGLEIILPQYKNAQLLIVGASEFDRQYYKAIKEKVNKNNLNQSVKIIDHFVKDNILREYISACDVFIFPNEKQTWGLAVVEAMALGKSCIVSSEAGVHEIIHQDENGLVFKCKDVNDLVQKMTNLIKNQELRAKLGKNAREYVFANFSWEKYAADMEKIIAKTVVSK